MRALKQTALAATLGALMCAPITPAMAAGPLLFAPWLLGGHVLGGLTRLATLPLVAASAAVAAPPPAETYPPPGGYFGQPIYYSPPPAYYGASQPYYGPSQAYYPPAMRYPYYSPPYTAPRYYAPPRGYYAPATRYPGYYGAQASYRSRGYSYRRP